MKFTAISDLHGYLPEDLPGGDVLCISGDIVPLACQNDFGQSVAWFCMDFAPWAVLLPYRKIVFIGGNHDFFLQELGDMYGPSSVMKHLLPEAHMGQSKLVYLYDNSVEIDGVRIYGTPWIANLERWAFFRYDEDLMEVYGRIPRKCDILLTHMPPLDCGAGCVLQPGRYNTMENYGSLELAEAISARDIRYALCGHVHSGNHCPEPFGCVANVVNVSLRDESYRVVYAPFNFEF